MNLKKALTNPQYWNLYSYCGNNPITYFDPDGKKVVIERGQHHKEIQQAIAIGMSSPSGAMIFQQLDSDSRTITLKGGNLTVGRGGAICGQRTGFTIKGLFIESATFTIDFNNINAYHKDKSGVTTVFHELFHASGMMQSNQESGMIWTKALGIVYRQDIPIPGGTGTGTQRGTAGQFGAKVAREVIKNISNFIINAFR